MFQGVRGVCAKISSSPVEISFEKPFWSRIKCGLIARLHKAGRASLEVLLLRRQQLLGEVLEMKRQKLAECLAEQKRQHKVETLTLAGPEGEDEYIHFSSGDEMEDEMLEEEGKVRTKESEQMLKSDSVYVRDLKQKKDDIATLGCLILYRYRKDYGKDLIGVSAPSAATAGAFVQSECMMMVCDE